MTSIESEVLALQDLFLIQHDTVKTPVKEAQVDISLI